MIWRLAPATLVPDMHEKLSYIDKILNGEWAIIDLSRLRIGSRGASKLLLSLILLIGNGDVTVAVRQSAQITEALLYHNFTK